MSELFGQEPSSVQRSNPVSPDGGWTMPLLVMRLLPGAKMTHEHAAETVRTANDALREGGALILDSSVVEPLLLIYAGQVIRFSGYGEEDYMEEPELNPASARPPERPARETW